MSSANPRPSPSPLMFWVLFMMGFAGLTPCVLLPEWREYQALQLTKQHEKHKLDKLEEMLQREERALEALQTDPAAVARLARRDLRFHKPGETVVHVPVVPVNPPDELFVPQAAQLPAALARWGPYLPPLDYDAVFCDPQTRTTLMAMSVGLIALAMVLFRKPARKPV